VARPSTTSRVSSAVTRPSLAFAAVAVLTGVGAGVAGTALVFVLHLTQHLAYGYGLGEAMHQQSFLQGVMEAPPLRRLIALSVCGAVAAVGWWALGRFGETVIGVPGAIRGDGARMPPASTIADAILQLVTVGLGSPLGREVAPRQVGAVWAQWLSRHFRLSDEERRVALACGAGAGLAAVYNVPLGGGVFALEVLLGSLSARAVVPALGTSALGATIAWAVLGDEPAYRVPPFAVGSSLVAWSIVCGPVFGCAAHAFAALTRRARGGAVHGARLFYACPIAFVAIGGLAVFFPQILGNGKGAAQLGFESGLTLWLALALFVIRFVIPAAALGSGARGGLLTPSFALGSLLGTLLGGLWSHVSPNVSSLALGSPSLGPFAIVGSAAFLAVAQNMPLTAVALTAEFTRVGPEVLFPILFAVAGAMAVDFLLRRRARPAGGAITGTQSGRERDATD
jgi:H+/Cl- antiporter ClcA